MQKKLKLKPVLGHVYAVPLLTGTYICGWVRAFAPKVSDPILLVVFKNVYQQIPCTDDINSLDLENAFKFYLVTKGGIQNATWIDLGESKKLKLSSWTIPQMCENRFGSKMFVCKYDESLNVIDSREATSRDISTIRHNDMIGFAVIENVLTLYLDDGLPTDFHLFQHF